MKPSVLALAAALVIATAPPAFAQTQPAPAPATTPTPGKGVGAVSSVTTKATVISVDLPTRVVVLEGENGVRKTIVVSDRVRNLPLVKPGDIVTMRYTEALAIQFARRGGTSSGSGVSVTETRAKPGERPGGVRTETITTTAVIVSIDPKKPGGVIRLEDGSLHDVKVKNKDVLRNLKVGDDLDVTFVRALAISVTSTPKS